MYNLCYNKFEFTMERTQKMSFEISVNNPFETCINMCPIKKKYFLVASCILSLEIEFQSLKNKEKIYLVMEINQMSFDQTVLTIIVNTVAIW